MIQNYYTLIKLTNELKHLTNAKVIAAFSQEKDTITFDLFDGNKEIFLHFSVAPFAGALFINNNYIRAKSNSIDICQEILGDTIQNITLTPTDRIIEIHLINHKIFCHIFGGGNANLFICNKNNKILFTLNNSNNTTGTSYNQTEHTLQNTNPIDNIQIIDYLTKNEFMFGKLYAMEFCYVNNLVENKEYEQQISALSTEDFAKLKQQAAEFANYLTTQNQSYILQSANNSTLIFSLIPLNNYTIIKTFESTSDAIKYQVVQNLRERKKNDILKELLPNLKRQHSRIAQNIAWAENSKEATERAEAYRQYAELLLSQPAEMLHSRGQTELQPTGQQMYPLDPKLSLLENANKYFSKARKATKDANIRTQRLPDLKAKLDKIQATIDRINEVKSLKELEKLKNEFVKKSVVIMQNEERPLNTKFRIFELGEGYSLYVGKNAANNDELTMKFAKSNDIWLHAKGCSGSHCVVKGGNNSQNLPKNILTKAAEIAAFYSDAKKASYTPVVYTQKKYIRKPKGANPGAVVLQKETTIMVTPKDPNLTT